MKSIAIPDKQREFLAEMFTEYGDFVVQESDFALVSRKEFETYISFKENKEDMDTFAVLLEREKELQSDNVVLIPSSDVISRIRNRALNV